MKLSAYLSLSRHGVFYFRWPLPRTDHDHDSRPSIKISLRTRCPVRAGTLARYLASCGEITRDNKELTRLRQDKLRDLVRVYFDTQLAQYLEWINNRGLSATAVEDARSEMLDHEDHLHSQRPTEMYLPIDRFKRKMDVSDEDWFDSLPNALIELRKGRRDLLRLVLEAAERSDGYSLGQAPATPAPPPVPPAAASAALGAAVEDFMAEHSRLWPEKTAGQFRSYANGAAQPNLSAKSLASFQLPLPPLDEQHRIVAVLDEAFEGLARARAHAEANIKNARELFENFLAGLMETKADDWQTYSFGDKRVLQIVDGDRGANYPKKSDFMPEGHCLFLSTLACCRFRGHRVKLA